MSYYPELQFLDLDDVTKEEADEIQGILQSERASQCLVLPWLQPPTSNSLHDYGLVTYYEADWLYPRPPESSEGECFGGGSGGQQVPSTLHQVYQPHAPQVLQLSYISPTFYPQQPPQVFEGTRRRNKSSPKSSGGVSAPATPTGSPAAPPGGSAASVAPSTGAYSPLPSFPYHPMVPGSVPPAHQYQYVGGAMQAAQHATGHPLFLTTQIPVYPPHMYTQYPPHQQVYNPALHSAGGHPGSAQERIPKPETELPSMQATSAPPQSHSGTSAPPHVGTSAPPLGVTAALPGATPANLGPAAPPPGAIAALAGTSLPPPGVITSLPNTTVSAPVGAVASLPGTLQTPSPSAVQTEVDLVGTAQPNLHHVSGSYGAHHQVASPVEESPRQQVDEPAVSAAGHTDQRVSPLHRQEEGDRKVSPVPRLETSQVHHQVQPERHPPLSTPALPPTQTEVETKSSEVQESVGAVRSKLLPPQSAIKTTSLPPSGAIKSKPSPLPGLSNPASVAPSHSQHQPPPRDDAPPLHVSQGTSVQGSTGNPVGSGKAMVSWAGLFKSSSPYMGQSQASPMTPSNMPPLPGTTETLQPNNSAKVVGAALKVGVMSKGPPPPPQNSMVVQPPPLLSSSSNYTPAAQHSATPTQPPTQPRPVRPPPGHSVANSQDPTLNRIAEVLSEYEPETRAVVLTPRGLNNPSNYCYINATLQALLACAPFYNLLATLAKHKPLHQGTSATPIIDSMIEFVTEFNVAPPNRLRKERCEKALARKEGGGVDQDPGILPGSPFEPSYVYSMVHSTSSLLQLQDRQEDAEEFLTVLLNGLNDEMIELLKLRGVGLSNGDVTTNGESAHADLDNSDWKEVLNNKGSSRVTRRTEVGRTPLTDIFMGQLRSRVERSDPQLSTDNIQPFFSLQLDVENCKTVEEALSRMMSEKAVEGGDDGASATTACYVDHCPLVLILHLKCFLYSDGRLTKISKSLDFPIDLKLYSKLQSNKSKPLSKATAYKLFAVVYHEGKEATKGHYIADVYHVGSSCWIRYDDAQVKSVSEQHVLNPKPPRVPYLLLYRRIDKHSRS